MEPQQAPLRRRGRPPKHLDGGVDTRELLLRAGVAALTEKGFAATGIDEVLRRVGVPKGSFYHYFDSKEAFGAALIARYGDYFARKLERHFTDQSLAPMARLRAFIADAQAGMARFDYQRGCLIGNLGQEMGAPEWYEILQAVVEAMKPYSRHGLNVNVDFYSGVIYQLHGMRMDLYVPIFAIGRMPGWVIQCLEQKRGNILIRPLTLYNGPQPRAWVPAEAR